MTSSLDLARNIVNQIADLYSEKIPSVLWVEVRQDTNDELDQFVKRLIEMYTPEYDEDVSVLPGIPYSTGGETAPVRYPNPHRREDDGIGLNGGAPRW